LRGKKMTIQYGAVGVNVALTGSITANATNKTAVCVFNNYTDTGVKTLGTVPANKVWRIVSLAVSVTSTTSANPHEAIIQLNDVDAFGVIAQGLATYGGGTLANSTQFSYDCAPVLTAGQTVKLKARSATVQTTTHFAYVEESA
jgi:hypothetical protein